MYHKFIYVRLYLYLAQSHIGHNIITIIILQIFGHLEFRYLEWWFWKFYGMCFMKFRLVSTNILYVFNKIRTLKLLGTMIYRYCIQLAYCVDKIYNLTICMGDMIYMHFIFQFPLVYLICDFIKRYFRKKVKMKDYLYWIEEGSEKKN